MATAPGPASDADALWRVLATRRDHRHLQPTPIPRETIERLLGVFAVAPSVGMSQPWHEGTRRRVVSPAPPPGPTLGTASVPASTEYSVVAAVIQLWLAVTAEGVGMGWVSPVEPDHLSASVSIPAGARPWRTCASGIPRSSSTSASADVGLGRRSPLSVDSV